MFFNYKLCNILTVLLTVILSHIYISFMFCHCISCIYSYRLCKAMDSGCGGGGCGCGGGGGGGSGGGGSGNNSNIISTNSSSKLYFVLIKHNSSVP
jgi:hypothetical protein